MEDQEMNFEQAYGSLSETDNTFEPLFIEEEDENYFEDCFEEIEAALTLPGESMPYSVKCREDLQAEFNGLMQQMFAELDVFDAAHPTTAPLELFSETENKLDKNGFPKTNKFGETCIPEKEQTVLEVEDSAVANPVEARPELSATMEIQKLREAFESCIEEVGQLERRRDELVQELLELEEPMALELQSLREALGEEQGLLSKVRLERQSMQEETQKTKRHLFTAARDGAQRQVELVFQQKQVEQLNQAQEELKALAVKLTEEITNIHSDHQSNLRELQKQLNVIQESSKRENRSYVTQGCRASCDLQQYLQGGIKALEEFYEPQLGSLLKRREATMDSLSKAKEQCQELRAQLGPLREEEQMLRLQRSCLEERIRLMERQRRENVEHYRETVDALEENIRELKTELKVQIKKTEELDKLKNSMAKELFFYREHVEGPCKQENSVVVEKT
ncbi:syncoilin-like [Cyprinus carpio]|uniref:Syncoilin-like n=1 Tax=Cyprinus carpio TaxID=7962 RepID=A0A9Q9Z668_CYPCA|nr:syncoilin-like [Cyprinus carpio]XP_042632762.1 syncoilin-like [Cyprinus carpio]XP_042632763.1 syncoilin-like [Cyprinus carpio]